MQLKKILKVSMFLGMSQDIWTINNKSINFNKHGQNKNKDKIENFSELFTRMKNYYNYIF